MNDPRKRAISDAGRRGAASGKALEAYLSGYAACVVKINMKPECMSETMRSVEGLRAS